MFLFNNDYDYWELRAPVTFDGDRKLIFINYIESEIDVKTNLYSEWKEWVQVRDNAKYEPALRTIGGDPLGAGQYAGDMYFLINGWQVVIDHYVKVNGILYSDDYPSPYIIEEGGGVFATVSSLALSYNTTGVEVPTVQDIRTELDNNSTKLALVPSIKTKVDSLFNGPTVTEIANQVRVELTPELTHILTLENNPGLTPTQATMLLELYRIMGLDPTKPLLITQTQRKAGDEIIQVISGDNVNTSTVTRQ